MPDVKQEKGIPLLHGNQIWHLIRVEEHEITIQHPHRLGTQIWGDLYLAGEAEMTPRPHRRQGIRILDLRHVVAIKMEKHLLAWAHRHVAEDRESLLVDHLVWLNKTPNEGGVKDTHLHLLLPRRARIYHLVVDVETERPPPHPHLHPTCKHSAEMNPQGCPQFILEVVQWMGCQVLV